MSILTALQAKVNAVDSDTSMSEIMKLAYAVKDHPYKSVYDSSGAMPIDSASIGSLRYAENQNAVYALIGITEGWKLLDSDAAKVTPTPPTYSVQGTTYGWSQGGYPGPANYHNQIQRYAFASSADAVDQGDLLSSQMHNASVGRTATAGLRIGGRSYPGTTYTDALSSYPFASGSNVVAAPGTLSAARAVSYYTSPSPRDRG